MENNGKVFRRAAKLVCLFWLGDKKWVAWGWLLALLSLLVAINVLNVYISYGERAVITSLQAKEQGEFWSNVIRYALIFVIGTPIVVTFGWVKGKLGLAWREWLTARFLGGYMDDDKFYRVNSDATVDNPDQRIQQDIPLFIDKVLTVSMALVDSSLAFVSFVAILWLISWKLVLVAIAYSTVGTIVMYLVGRRLIGLQFNQERLEADFRRNLMYTRENATQVASYRGARRELKGLSGLFGHVAHNWNSVLSWQRNLRLFKTSYDYFILVVPMVMTAPMYFAGVLDMGGVVQAGTSFGRVLGALSVIVGQFEIIADLAANSKRLITFNDSLDAHDKALSSGSMKEMVVTGHGAGLVVSELTVKTPDGDRTLVRDLSLALKPGERLIITGESGVGKSSVLKALSGLWSQGSGEVARPAPERVLFLPQKPYMPLGDLREQLVYPGRVQPEPSDDELLRLLDAVGLADVAQRMGGLDAVRPWQEQLSSGQQQKIAFARLLLMKPDLIILDEATSALDPESERRFYEAASACGATVVSVAHRKELIRYHDFELKLMSDGTHEIRRIV